MTNKTDPQLTSQDDSLEMSLKDRNNGVEVLKENSYRKSSSSTKGSKPRKMVPIAPSAMDTNARSRKVSVQDSDTLTPETDGARKPRRMSRITRPDSTKNNKADHEGLGPGAVAVPGVSASPHDVIDIEDPPQFHAVTTARVVDHDEESRLRSEVEQLRELAKSAVSAQHVVAIDHGDEEKDSSDRKFCTKGRRFGAAAIVLLGIIAVAVLAVVVSRQNKPPPPIADELKTLVSTFSPDKGEALADTTSAQYKALTWLQGNENRYVYSERQKIQRYVLAVIYYSTNGDHWINNDGWLSDNNECSWYAEYEICTGRAVSYLHLNDNNLTGTVPAEISMLSDSLERLYLQGNYLSGRISPSLGQLTNLDVLSLYNNTLTGTIPNELSQMTSLDTLYLSMNALTGTIISEVGELTELQEISLFDNKLSGTIPDSMWQLTNLVSLLLSVNHNLGGTLPSNIDQLTDLADLTLNRCALNGTIPKQLGSLSSMGHISLFGNDLSGTIPKELGQLTELKILDLHENDLSGPIPLEVGQLPNLEALLLFGNKHLSGNFTCPSSIETCAISCDDHSNPSCRSV